MTNLKKSESNVVRLMGSDAEYIKREIDEANQAFGKSLEHYRNAGERLATVRDDFKNKKKIQGEGFKTWVENNCGFNKSHAYRYISVWENWDEIVSLMRQSGDVFTLVDALKAIREIKATAMLAQDEAYDTAFDAVVTEAQSNIETRQKALTDAEAKIKKQQDDLTTKIAENQQQQLLGTNKIKLFVLNKN